MIDRATIFCQSGDGGLGAMSFRREKYVPFGGPDGGNGGNGGCVYIKGDESLNSLLKFRHVQHFKAGNGTGGSGANKTGAKGEDVVITVPFGTDIFIENQLIHSVFDMNIYKLFDGGRGGIGNSAFATSVDRAPRKTLPPTLGIKGYVKLQLKLIGDISIVGMPNSGKSSLLNILTNAKSFVADYAFSTTSPVQGVFEYVTLIDLPGLIEGASEGVGLGNLFLSHAERSLVFFLLLDIRYAVEQLDVLLHELRNINKPVYVICNKIELTKSKHNRKIKKHIRSLGFKCIMISVHKKININQIKGLIYKTFPH